MDGERIGQQLTAVMQDGYFFRCWQVCKAWWESYIGPCKKTNLWNKDSLRKRIQGNSEPLIFDSNSYTQSFSGAISDDHETLFWIHNLHLTYDGVCCVQSKNNLTVTTQLLKAQLW